MESIRVPYKQDDFGNDIFARTSWAKNETQSSRPIGKPFFSTASAYCHANFRQALIYHGGGLLVGSSEIIPQPQIDWLASHGFVVVIPNYRLAPQVTGSTSLADGVEAHDWAASRLADTMKSHGVQVNISEIVSMGHSSGGTIALHVGSCRPVKAVTAFYPSLYLADESSAAHRPYNGPPFGNIPDYVPTEEDWQDIAPATKQISESTLAAPNMPPPPRSRWQVDVCTKGKWMSSLCPDGDYASIDPLTRVTAGWPPIMFVCGEDDAIPGSTLDLMKRAEDDMRKVGVKEVVVEIVPRVGHMFDLLKPLGAEDLGSEWQSVVAGLQFLKDHVKT
jgi:acetyl esterase/lipase